MQPEQQDIYYIAGDSLDTVSKSPLLERLIKNDYEVFDFDNHFLICLGPLHDRSN